MEKPSLKFFIVFNLVMNIPLATAMSIGGMLFSGNADKLLTPALLVNILLGFVFACIVNAALPIPLIAISFPKLFKIEPESIPGRILGNVPVVFIFVIIIGLVMNFANVQVFGGAPFPAFIFAFLGTFIPMYILCFAVAMIFIPIAQGAAAKSIS
ncbi:hypothetical protein [Oribacterium sp. WCC10]|uniref:hypothetical protein n=1 Tax=Oribacterium sp. WCC10 TaxID=1855343 RepID=UPI0008E816EC|nr:hypothetical protein [Oribacterium sp. WCC10]SFG65785.1 hypothetical protein SAMN05216356_11759 [Oribacterium sp. WCC10]